MKVFTVTIILTVLASLTACSSGKKDVDYFRAHIDEAKSMQETCGTFKTGRIFDNKECEYAFKAFIFDRMEKRKIKHIENRERNKISSSQ